MNTTSNAHLISGQGAEEMAEVRMSEGKCANLKVLRATVTHDSRTKIAATPLSSFAH